MNWQPWKNGKRDGAAPARGKGFILTRKMGIACFFVGGITSLALHVNRDANRIYQEEFQFDGQSYDLFWEWWTIFWARSQQAGHNNKGGSPNDWYPRMMERLQRHAYESALRKIPENDSLRASLWDIYVEGWTFSDLVRAGFPKEESFLLCRKYLDNALLLQKHSSRHIKTKNIYRASLPVIYISNYYQISAHNQSCVDYARTKIGNEMPYSIAYNVFMRADYSYINQLKYDDPYRDYAFIAIELILYYPIDSTLSKSIPPSIVAKVTRKAEEIIQTVQPRPKYKEREYKKLLQLIDQAKRTLNEQ